MRYKRVEHIGIAVEDLDRVVAILRDAIGLPCDRIVDYPEFHVRVAFFPVGETQIELVQGTRPDSEIARYVAERGNGLHHVCLEVDDIEATLDELRARGVKLADRVPRQLDETTRFAFLDPQGTGGFSLELYERRVPEGPSSGSTGCVPSPTKPKGGRG